MDENIKVNFGQNAGAIKAIHGVNMGPWCLDGGFDMSEFFSEIKFPTVRLHDCPYYFREVVDIPCIFPLFHLDAADPKNYKFARTDAYIQSILDCGSDIVYRLGVSIESLKGFNWDTNPPADYEKWANICVNIIRHYNEGWADGFEHNIQYWEIWNEPDNGPGMWNGTFEEFVEFYVTVTRIIREKCPNVKIGGPAFNGGMQGVAVNEYMQSKVNMFLQRVKETDSPLDFFSWHSYPDKPSHLTEPAIKVREILDDNGFTETESHLNEWNLAPFMNTWGIQNRDPHMRKIYDGRIKGMENASLIAASLIAFQDVPIDMTNFYDASNGMYGMFYHYGWPAKPFFAFKAFNKLLCDAPNKVEVIGSEPEDGLAVLAGKSVDDSKRMILMTNFHKPQGLWKLSLSGLADGESEMRIYVVDENNDLVLEKTQAIEGQAIELEIKVSPGTIRLVEIQNK